jgi:hypothetical protein
MMMLMFDSIKKWLYNQPRTTKKLNLKGTKIMTTSYTPEMIKAITDSAPLDLVKAHTLSAQFGNVSYRSVISKAKSLKIDYISKAPAAKKDKVAGPTKMATLAAIRGKLNLPAREGDLTKTELETVLEILS